MMGVQIALPLLGLAILIPLVQQLLTLPKWIVSKIPIALLMYVPGLLVVFWSINDRVGDVRRLECVYLLTGPSVLAYLPPVCLLTAVYVFIFEVLRRLRVKNWAESGEPRFTPGLYRPLAGILLILIVICTCAANYKSLEDAVAQNDLDLAARRLKFNLAGAGPNNGRIEDWGTAGVHTSPLLPLAVRNGSIEMARLLIQHGAELNPEPPQLGKRGWANPEWNMLYYATINDDMRMLEFLVEQGGDPTRNITTAVKKKNIGHLAFLLNHGGDVEVVRHELKEEKLEKELAGMLAQIAEGARTHVGSGWKNGDSHERHLFKRLFSFHDEESP
ncbi:MAG: hypothetical protein JNK74_00005 [Candidatus Hydrogenedentes bacterium]|nr:hypothetical protein [Candidatus Hydrogenedentota bacterium]